MNVNVIAQNIRDATKGIGTNEKALIQAMTNLPPSQIPHLEAHFKTSYGTNIVDVLRSETNGAFGKLLIAAAQPEAVLAAQLLHEACKGLGTNEAKLIEVLVGRDNWELNAIKQTFKALYNKDLEQVLDGELSGDLKRFFLSLLQAGRDEVGQFVNVEQDVEAFYKAGAGRMGTDEAEFIRLLSSRNYYHLAQVFLAYATKYGVSVEKVVKKEFGGKLEDALIATVRVAENRGDYFAALLESSMSGVGTDEDKLRRIIVRLRGTPQMQWTREAYMKRYGKSLENRIKGETSGDHEKLLVAMVNQPVW